MRILFFAQLKEVTACASTELALADADTEGLWRELIARYPGLARFKDRVRIARNCEFVAAGTRLSAADEIALIPPVSGG